MQRFLKSILSFGLAVSACFGMAAFYGSAESTVAEAATGYYSGITATSGNALLGQLHDLIVETHKTYTTYDDCKGSKVQQTDPGPDGGVLDFYTQKSIYTFSGTVGTWNREHVWCQSLSNGLWGTSGGGSDMHHIRPSEAKINSNRGNKTYGIVSSHSSSNEEWSYNTNGGTVALGGYSYGNTFEPLDNVKGDVARIVMYVYTHYNNASNVGGTKESAKTHGNLPFTNIMSASSDAAAKKMLLEWNKLDPVDEIETTRNEAVYQIQGNRNPFIDNESYADAIWGDGTVVDPNPGPGPQPSETLKSITLNATALTLNVGNTYNLTVTPSPSSASASVTWTSSNESIATVSNGKVTAKAAGTTTITATSTGNSAIKATVTVTVLQSSSSEIGTGKVTITRDCFTNASGGYGLYDWTANGVNGVAYIYAGQSDSMQFNTNKSSCYLASTTPTDGAIKKVTIKTSGNSSWTLLTSTQPYSGITDGNPNSGNTHTSSDGSWTVSGNDTYFALVLGGVGASYIESIEVEYETGSSSEKPIELQSIAINPSAFTLKKGASTNLSVLSAPSSANAEVNWTSSNPSVAQVDADGTVTAVAVGTATITATSKSNPAITASATVTVTAAPISGSNERVNAFYDALALIDDNDPLFALHNSINAAIEAYRNLTDADKTECADGIEILQSAIASYNETIKVYSGSADSADKTALKSAGRFL